jgi:hypothetical protein
VPRILLEQAAHKRTRKHRELLIVAMRLSPQQQHEIKRLTHEIFGRESTVRLFGSRVDDTRRGGDIDLFIQPEESLDANSAFQKKIDFLVALEKAIGEQKVDVIVDSGKGKPIERVATETGVVL